jgi:hypothetical protein
MGNDTGEKEEVQMGAMIGGNDISPLRWNILLSEGFESPE